jgi:hypothetical protein
MAIWRMTDEGPVPLRFSSLDLERRLEDMIVHDPSLTGTDLLVIGRQVSTRFGGNIDVLAVDADGFVHVLELKRGRTPREVVAQVLDYGSWVQQLDVDQVSTIFTAQNDRNFDEAFADRFGRPVPDLFNSNQQLTIVASDLDPASERIVAYLAEQYSVPLNAVFFRHFADASSEYLARTWLLPPEEVATRSARTMRRVPKVRPWNGRDFYVILGNVKEEAYRWEIGRTYGFVGAGGGSWYSKPLRNLTLGKRVFAYVGGAGYVGIGEVTGQMLPLRDLEVEWDGKIVRVIDQPEIGEDLRQRAWSNDEHVTEYAVPVQWLAQRPVPDAVAERGLFASTVTVCKLRDDRTIECVVSALGLDESDDA